MKQILILVFIVVILCSGCAKIAPSDIDSELKELKSLGIITQDDLMSGDKITVLEGLRVIYKASAGYDAIYNDPENLDLEGGYSMKETKALDSLNDVDKAIFQELMMESVLQSSDIINLKIDSPLTKYQALVFITRLLGSTYGCIQVKEESSFTKKSQTLGVAVQEGLVQNDNSKITDEPISRYDYFHLIYKALYTTISRGGYAGVNKFQYISLFSENNKKAILKSQKENEEYENNRKVKNKLSVKATISDTLSISWELPEEINRKSEVGLSIITKEGKEIEQDSYGEEKNFRTLSSENILDLLYGEYPTKINYVRVNYFGVKNVEKNYYIDIDVSSISIVVKGEPLEPLTYRQVRNNEYLSFILGKKNSFRKGLLYCLTLHDKESQNPAYYERFLSFFKCRNNSKTYTIEAVMGSIVNDGDKKGVDFRLQEIDIQKKIRGFIIYMTPEPDKPFKFIP